MKKLRIAIEIPRHLHKNVEQGVYYCSEAIRSSRVARESADAIELELEDSADPQSIEAIVREWLEQTIASTLEYEDTTLRAWGDFDSGYRATPEQIHAHPEFKPLGEGMVALGPTFARIFKGLVELCEGVASDFGAQPFTVPSVCTRDHMQRCNYLHQFPQMLSFVTHLREDFEVLEEYADACRSPQPGADCEPRPEALQGFRTFLRPAVCYNIWPYFEGEVVEGEPFLGCTLGECYRYESRNTTELDRLFSYRVYETVALGSAESVLGWRERQMQAVVALLERLELPGRIKSGNDPFFVAGSVMKSTFQRAHELKYELELPFPNREGNLAAGSFNIHQQFFGERFDIRTPVGDVAHTGCSGLGIDRVLAALLVRHGLDLGAWPETARSSLDLA